MPVRPSEAAVLNKAEQTFLLKCKGIKQNCKDGFELERWYLSWKIPRVTHFETQRQTVAGRFFAAAGQGEGILNKMKN